MANSPDNIIIQLERQNVVPCSEVITLKGANQTALIRDQDYLIDYKNGLVEFLIQGAIGTNPTRFREDVRISYRFAADFSQFVDLKSHTQIFNESAELGEAQFEFVVDNSPVQSVQRVENLATRERYTVTGFTGSTIITEGLNPPATEELDNQIVTEIALQIIADRAEITVALSVPDIEGVNAVSNPVLSVTQLNSETAERRVIKGKASPITEQQLSIITTRNVSSFQLRTGSTILRNSNSVLIGTTNTLTAVTQVDYFYTILEDSISITFTARGLAKIGKNNVYATFSKQFVPTTVQLINEDDLETAVSTTLFKQSLFEETVTFNTATKSLTVLPQLDYVTAKQTSDQKVAPSVFVTNGSRTVLFEQGTDYVVDFTNNTIKITGTGSIKLGNTVVVLYREPETIKASYIYQKETVAIDYEYGDNTVDWSESFIEQPFAEIKDIREGIPFTVLSKFPSDFEQILIYREDDSTKTSIATPITFNTETQELSFRPLVPPRRGSGRIVFEYVAREQLLQPSDNYFVSYRYGARRDALLDNFAVLLGIEDQGTFERNENVSLGTRESKVKIAFAPTSIEDILIHRATDPDEAALTTVRSQNQLTNEIVFDPLVSAEDVTISYRSPGFATEDLRKVVIGLIDAFLQGPTKQAVRTLILAFTELEPEIIETVKLGFKTASTSDTLVSDRLNEIAPKESSRLDNDKRSIEFVSGKLDRALQIRSQNQAFVQYDAQDNLPTREGTIEFLVSNLFEGNDQKTHYFFDWIGTDESTNRISLYKSSRDRLAFEIRDCESTLHRISTDISRINQVQLFALEKGATQIKLAHIPAHGIIDLDDSNAADVLEAEPSEFFIYPVFEGSLKGCILNVTTLVRLNRIAAYTTDESFFASTAVNLRALADLYESHSGKLTIHTELEFMQGSISFDDNVLLELHQRGHEVGIFIDYPPALIGESVRAAYIGERLDLLKQLQINTAAVSISGGFRVANYPTVVAELGFTTTAAFKDPLTGIGLVPKKVNPFRPSDADFTKPDLSAPIVHIPGDITISTLPFDSATISALTVSFNQAIDAVRFQLVNSWYWVLDIENLQLGALTVDQKLSLLDDWITDNIDSADNNVPTSNPAARVTPEWATLSEIRNKFLSYEQWIAGTTSDLAVRDTDLLTDSISATETTIGVSEPTKFVKNDLIQIGGEILLVQQVLTHQLVVDRAINGTAATYHRAQRAIAIFDVSILREFQQIRTRGLQPLSFDASTMIVTFSPAPESGIYAFDYISGWSEFDEQEHFVAAVWKLHSDDCVRPFLRLFIDGKCIDQVTFSSLLIPAALPPTDISELECDGYGYGYSYGLECD